MIQRILALAILFAAPSLAAPTPLSEVIVTVSEDEQPLASVLKKLQEAHGLNYVVSQEVLKQAGLVTVHLKDVPLDVALESICAGCGLRIEVRGPVLVISVRGKDEPVIPRVEARLPEPLVETPGRPSAPEPQRPSRLDEADLAQAVGILVLVDPKNRLVQLRVDGVKRDFYLPETDDLSLPGDQVSRLEQSLATLKPGTRIALLYRRHATHPVVTDLVGGAFNDTPQARKDKSRRRRPKPEAAPAGDVASVATPTESQADLLLEQLKQEQAARLAAESASPGEEQEDEAPGGSVKIVPSGPAASPTAAPEGAGTVSDEGILGGAFQGLSGEEVRLVRASDGREVTCLLPKDEPQNAERRKRIAAALGGMKVGDKLYMVFQEIDGKKYIKDTISQSGR